MKRFRKIKDKTRVNKIGVLFIALIVVFSAVKLIESKINNKNLMEDDFKIGVITESGLEMISISENRRMVNLLKVEGEANVWLPNEGIWKPVNQLKNTITASKNNQLIKDIFWYNFGFAFNKYTIENEINWKNDFWLISKMGLPRWIKYKINSGQMIVKEEKINNRLEENGELLDEIMPRDFAENKILSEDLRLSVFNATSQSGLANFVGNRLEWAGFTVISTENTNNFNEKCLLIGSQKAEVKIGWKKLLEIFKECKIEYSDKLYEDEAELYFGDSFVSMIKYSSYKN
jgi:hypothetical protein